MRNAILLLTAFIAYLALSSAAQAQSNNDKIEQYIRDVCAEVIQSEVQNDLTQVCLDATAGPVFGNAGSVGASGTTSNVTAYLKRRAIEKKEKEEKKERKRKKKPAVVPVLTPHWEKSVYSPIFRILMENVTLRCWKTASTFRNSV